MTPDGDASPGVHEARVFLKAEHLQVTGSFKARGAFNRVLTMTAEERARGISIARGYASLDLGDGLELSVVDVS